jgi:predicted patatin/cPLA2 family phospholipase
VRCYTEQLTNRAFINPWRPWRVVDIDYMVDTALKRHCPLDVQRVATSPSLLHVVLTRADTGDAEIITNRDPGNDIYEICRASSALPVLYNRKVPIAGHRYVDGGLVDLVPVIRAFALGCTDVLVIVTTQKRIPKRSAPWRGVLRTIAASQSRPVRQRLASRDALYYQTMDILDGLAAPPTGGRLWVVHPSDPEKLVGIASSNKSKLEACAQMAREDTERVLNSLHGQT